MGLACWVTAVLSGTSRVRHRPTAAPHCGGGTSPVGIVPPESPQRLGRCAGRDNSCRPGTIDPPTGAGAGRLCRTFPTGLPRGDDVPEARSPAPAIIWRYWVGSGLVVSRRKPSYRVEEVCSLVVLETY